MARIFTWTGRGGGDIALLGAQFYSINSYYPTVDPHFGSEAKMGGSCLLCDEMGAQVKISIGTKSEIYVGFLCLATDVDWGRRIMAFLSGSTVLATVYHAGTTSGSESLNLPYPAAYRGDVANLLGGGSGPAPLDQAGGAANYVEVYYKPGVSDGRFVIKINGRIDCDYTGQTVPSAQTTLDYILIGSSFSTAYAGFYYNDIVVDDAEWPGQGAFAHLVPTGAGNSEQWTPSAGNAYECVDETPPTFDDYNKTSSVDQSESFVAANLPAAADAVKSVSVRVFGSKEGAPTPTQVKSLVRTGSTDYVGDGKTMALTITEASKVWQVSPYTSVAWTLDDVNGMEIGYKSAA